MEPRAASPAAGAAAIPGWERGRDLIDVGLALRLFALAIVAGSGALLPLDGPGRLQLIGCVLAGAALGMAQHQLLRRGRATPARWLIGMQVALWTLLLGWTGGQRSPMFVGYLLEIGLTGVAFSRRAAEVTAFLCLAAFVARAAWLEAPLDPLALAYVAGFIAIGAVLTAIVADLILRQRQRLHEYHDSLQRRANSAAEELRLVGDHLGAGLVALDDLGRVVAVNPAGLRVLGVPGGEVAGRPWQEVLAVDASGSRELLCAFDEGAPRRGLPLLHTRPDGGSVGLCANVWSSTGPEGRRVHILLDESDGTRGEEDPLHRLGEAVACVAHQFRNSVHALQGLAGEMLREGRAGQREREPLEAMLGVVEGLGELSRDVLAVSGAARGEPEILSLADVLRSVSVLARGGRARLVLDVPESDPRVRARRGTLVHALYNLVDNALRVTPAGERVHVSVATLDGVARVTVADRGPGLPDGHPFGRLRDAGASGSGYGLLAARRFLAEMGGALEFAPRSGGGTTCVVTLPCRVPCAGGE